MNTLQLKASIDKKGTIVIQGLSSDKEHKLVFQGPSVDKEREAEEAGDNRSRLLTDHGQSMTSAPRSDGRSTRGTN